MLHWVQLAHTPLTWGKVAAEQVIEGSGEGVAVDVVHCEFLGALGRVDVQDDAPKRSVRIASEG